MDWRILFTTFVAVFIAEFADKTQLVGMGMSAKTGRPWVVWCASVLAYSIVTAMSVLVGATLGKHIKPEFIRYCGALLFIMIGVLIFWRKI